MAVDLRTAVKRVHVDDVKGSANNVKAHDVDLVASSIRRFGFADPLVVDQRTGELLAGHGRLAALRVMRDAGEDPPQGVTAKWEAPVYVGWSSRSDDEADAARVALNRSSEVGGWDEPALLDLMERLSQVDGGFVGIGFNEGDLEDLRSALADLPDLGDLDDIADEYGDLDGREGWVTIRLEVPQALGSRWREHREAYDTDGEALEALL